MRTQLLYQCRMSSCGCRLYLYPAQCKGSHVSCEKQLQLVHFWGKKVYFYLIRLVA